MFPRASSIRGAAGVTAGFTFIEVVIALAVAAILIATVCVTLITALRAEERVDTQREAEQRANELAAYLFAGYAPSNAIAAWSDRWSAASQVQSIGEGTNRIDWRVWEIRTRQDPGDGVRMALRCQAARADQAE